MHHLIITTSDIYSSVNNRQTFKIVKDSIKLKNIIMGHNIFEEEFQNTCWFDIVNTVEDMVDKPTWDEVIELLKKDFIVIPKNVKCES